MQKEILICIVIVALILIGNYITGNYEMKAINKTSNNLNEIKEQIKIEDVDEELLNLRLENLNNEWNKFYPKLAYFIEHDELEKVKTNLTTLTSLSKNKEYIEAISEIDKSLFVLEHIREKNALNLENIF